MKSNFDPSLELVLKEEGGYVNNPKDPGGMTNLGVTKRAWEAWMQRSVTEAEMRGLTPEAVGAFYKAQYWDKICGDQLPKGLDYAAFDLAVNSGASRAIRYMQQLAGVPQDGILGPKSLEAIREADVRHMADAICELRIDFLRRLADFSTFGKGWSSRVSRVRLRAMTMIDAGKTVV